MTSKPTKESISSQQRRFSLKLWIGIPFALFLGLLVILSQIDLESVKKELVQRISKETGLTVEISSMRFGFSRGLGLQCQGVKVNTPEGHRFSVNRLHLLAEWDSLLQGKFKIKSAALEHPKITLEISSSVKPPSVDKIPEKTNQRKLIDPETIRSAMNKLNSSPLFIDPETIHSVMNKLNSSPLFIAQLIVSDGEITLVRSGTANQLSFNVDGTLVINQGGRLDIAAKSVKVQTGSLIFEGEAMATNLTAENAALSLNMNFKGFSWETLQPIFQFFSSSKNEIPLKAVDVDKLFIQAEIPINALNRMVTLQKQITSQIEIKTRNAILNIGGKNISIDSLNGKGTLKNSKLIHNLKGNLLGGEISIKGILGFQKFKEKFLIAVNSDLSLKQVNLNLASRVYKNKWVPTLGTVTGNLNIRGPISSDGKISPALKLKGTLQADELASEDKQIEKATLEFKESSTTLTQVKVELEKIQFGDQRFNKMMGLFQITSKEFGLAEGRIWPVNGLIQLVGNLKPKSGIYNLKFKGNKLKVEEFLSPHLIGPMQLSGTLGGTLPQNTNTLGITDYLRNLSGSVKIKLIDGTLPELGALEQFFTLLNPRSVLDTKKTGLGYDYLGGDFKITKGLVHTSNLEMKGPQIKLSVEGQANLVADTINVQVKAMPLQMLDKTLKAIPLLGELLTDGGKGGLIETYFKANGKLSKPDFTMQPNKSLLEKSNRILKELFKIPKFQTSGK